MQAVQQHPDTKGPHTVVKRQASTNEGIQHYQSVRLCVPHLPAGPLFHFLLLSEKGKQNKNKTKNMLGR